LKPLIIVKQTRDQDHNTRFPAEAARGLVRLIAKVEVWQLTAGVTGIAILAAVIIGTAIFAVLEAFAIQSTPLGLALTAAVVAVPIVNLLARTVAWAKRSAQELRRRESLLISAQRLAGMGHWRMHLGSNAFEFSEDLRLIYGVPDGMMRVTVEMMLDRIVPEDRARVQGVLMALIDDLQDQEVEYRVTGADGVERSVWADGCVECDPNGRPTAVYGVVQDITGRKRIEQDLRMAKDDAEAASRTKTEFLANMSHELRTPLNAILGFSEVIRDAIAGPLDARYRDYARDIQNSGQHLLELINDLLDLTKIEARQLTLQIEELDLARIFDGCRRFIAERAKAGGVELIVHLPPHMPSIFADELRLKQILLNLLSNAVKFTPGPGRVMLTATITASDAIELAVADTGIGMRPEDIPIALEPFRQLDSSLSRRFEGTGLGLPLARTLTELHGGTLDIRSEPSRGTTVTVTLPRAQVRALSQTG
jgi:two-component system cell cycle sensor histidine kinase PleC